MQLPSFLRRAPALLTSLLLFVATAGDAFARTQEANLIPVVTLATSTITDAPSAIRGNLLLGTDGNIYMISSLGGSVGYGSVAKLAPDGTLTAVHGLANGNEGYNAYSGLMQATDGNFYGATYFGGTEGSGAIFKVTPDGTYTVLRSLGQNKQDAQLAYGGLVQGPDGNLYGTTLRGGTNDKGTVYRISTSGDFAILFSFAGGDGENPEGTLIVGADGNLYGTTLQGGDANRGTVFRISTGGSLTRLYSFPSLGNFNALGLSTNATGANPRAGLLLAADGNYYGTAYQGGANGYGTVFKMTPAGVVTALHAFGGPPFASGFPLSSISQDAAGNLYGTTESGGYLNQGTAWRIDPAGQYSLLHSFAGTLLDGSKPYGTLLVVGNSLYGATFSDSVGGAGAIFKLDLGSNGALPVEFSVSTTDIDVGASATLTWSSPTASTCTSGGAWTDTVGTSGSLAVTPPSAGIYTYTLTCTDGASVVRTASTAVRVKAPAAQPVDAGGSGGGGALSIPALLLLGALALRKKL